MTPTTKRYFPGGRTRALWRDDWAAPARAHGVRPRRASQVFVVENGPAAGRFAVDFSLLGPDFQFCAAATFVRYDEAVRYEQRFIAEHWIGAGCCNGNAVAKDAL